MISDALRALDVMEPLLMLEDDDSPDNLCERRVEWLLGPVDGALGPLLKLCTQYVLWSALPRLARCSHAARDRPVTHSPYGIEQVFQRLMNLASRVRAACRVPLDVCRRCFCCWCYCANCAHALHASYPVYTSCYSGTGRTLTS